MKRLITAAAVALVAAAAAFLAFGPDLKSQGTPTTPIRVQFGWLFDVHHAGFFVADELGYYKQEGLAVELLAGGLDANAIKSVVTGGAQIGQAGGLEQVVTAWAENIPITAFAAIHRETPHALVSLAKAPITKPSDLPGKTVAVAFGDAAEVLFNALLARHNIQRSAVDVVPFRFDLTPLIQEKVTAVTGFSTDQPATLEVQGLKSAVLTYGSQGIHSYGYTFFASNDYVARNEQVIRRFVAASRRGWERVFANPDEALQIVNKRLGGRLNLQAEKLKFERIRPLMLANGKLATWRLEPTIIKEATDRLVTQKQLTSPPTRTPILAAE